MKKEMIKSYEKKEFEALKKEMIKSKELVNLSKDVVIWCGKKRIEEKDEYRNNAYLFKHECEQEVGHYVSSSDVALGFLLAGFKVVRHKPGIYSIISN